MAKCLRCGAESEWIEGRVPDEQPEAVEDLVEELYDLYHNSQLSLDELRASLLGIVHRVKR